MTTIVTRAGKGSALTHNELDTNLTNLNTAKLEAADIAGKSDVGHTHTLANVSDVTITVSNLNSLDDGIDSTLHFHATDRARSNHTGTQTASTISDFNSAADARIAAASINALSDVVVTTPSNGQVLKYNGTNWVNDTDATGGGGGALDDLTDVVITTPSTGQVLKYNGTNWINDTDATGGGGSVTVTGTPADNQIAIWTGSSAIEGDSDLTYNTSTNTLGLVASGKIAVGGTNIIDDSAGITTLSNIDALDATTESTVEAAIDTLPNLTSVQGRTVTLADAGADAVFGWDDSANQYANLSAADARTALGLTTLATTTPGTGIATFLANPSSDNLRAAITDEEGDSKLLFSNANVTLSTATNLVRSTHGNRFLVCDTAATHTVEDDTTGGWGAGDVLYGVNTSAGNVVLQGDGTATVTAENGATLTVPAGRFWSLQRINTNDWRGGSATTSGSGDVTKVGTPANNQMAVWTGDGTLEGTSDFTYDGTSLNLITGKNLQIAGSTVLADSAGTTTLSNIDALDATTESTIEAAIDTLANLTSIQGNTFTLTGAFVRSGAHSLTLTTTGTTNVTFPTSGTLATQTEAKTEQFCVACSDETTDLTTGTAKVTFRMPYAMTLTGVRASVTTAPTGANLIVDINESGSTIMTTNKLSIDAGEKTSTTATTAAGITDSALADDAEITIDIDQVGSTVAGTGLKVWFIGTRA